MKKKNTYKLGARLDGPVDHRTVHFSAYRKTLKELPEKIVWDSICARRAYRPFGNHECGNCMYVAPANLVVGAAANTGDSVKLTKDEVIDLYAKGTGYNPDTGQNDNGSTPEQVLKQLSKLPEGNPMRVIAWGKVNVLDMREVREACWLFGGIIAGFQLPENCLSDIGKTWKFKPKEPGFMFGSWGGHAVLIRFINWSQGKKPDMRCITWGKQQKFTDLFYLNYCVCGYFAITEKWIADHNGETPNGFDLDRLLKDVERLKND